MTPKAWTKAQVGQRAEAFALSVDFLPGDDSLEPLVERLGGRVYVGERPDGPSGGPSGLSLYRNGFEIRLPNLTTTERLRFTIAHELGHWVLHRTQGQETGPLDCRNDRNDQTRWEANWFAAALLMPEDHFRQSCRLPPLQ